MGQLGCDSTEYNGVPGFLEALKEYNLHCKQSSTDFLIEVPKHKVQAPNFELAVTSLEISSGI
jgi:hypothetical protein